MSAKALYLFPCGELEVDKSVTTYRQDMGKIIRIPVIAALIKTDEGWVLFDTGLNPYGLEDPIGTWGERASKAVCSFRAEDDIRNRLKELGLTPKDIKFVVNSHLHWDHTGGNQFFTKSTFIVQKAEFRYAYYPDTFAASAYLKNHFDHPLKYELIEGDYVLVPGISLVVTPGHTPGSQAMIVDLPKFGTVILTADAIYSKENVDKNIPAGNCVDPVQAMLSMARLIHISRRENGKLFITHDPKAWADLKASPYCYE